MVICGLGKLSMGKMVMSMTEKRFTWVKHTYDSLGTIIDNETGKDLMGTKETCKFMNKREERIRELEDENEQLKQFKELIYTVLKQEYEDRINEMNMWAEKEEWNGYRATKLEYGTLIRIAKKMGVDLND